MSAAKLGHAHLFVRDVKRSTAFYSQVLGLEVTEQREGAWAFLSSGEAHHELALSQLGMDAPAPAAGAVGLFHLAFDLPNKVAFAQILSRLLDRGIEVEPVDHRISWGVYFSDPDGNGLEISCDTRSDPGGSAMWEGDNRPLTTDQILTVLKDS